MILTPHLQKTIEGCFFLFWVKMLPGSPPGDPPEDPRGIPRSWGGLRRFIFVILGLGAGDPQVPTGRGSRPGYEGILGRPSSCVRPAEPSHCGVFQLVARDGAG